MKNTPLFSIIIPVYNEGHRLARSIESVRKQSISDIELILIDDGSSDPNTIEIIDRYSMEEKRIRVIHQENKGVSSARNKGIDESHGEYLIFLDGDDYLESDTCQQYQNCMEKYDREIDMLMTNYMTDDEKTGNQQVIRNIDKNELFEKSAEKAIQTLFSKQFYTNRGCFRAELIKREKIRFNEEWAVFEDIDFTLRAIQKAGCLVITPIAKYYYCLFGKHTDLSFRRFNSQINACVSWLDRLQAGLFSGETDRHLIKMLTNIMSVYLLKVVDVPREERAKAFAVCATSTDYLRYGSVRSKIIYYNTMIWGVKRTLVLFGALYRFTQRGVAS